MNKILRLFICLVGLIASNSTVFGANPQEKAGQMDNGRAVSLAFLTAVDYLDISQSVIVVSKELSDNEFLISFFPTSEKNASAVIPEVDRLSPAATISVKFLPYVRLKVQNISKTQVNAPRDENKKRASAIARALLAFPRLSGMFSFRAEGRYDKWDIHFLSYPQVPGGHSIVTLKPDNSIDVVPGV